MYLILGAGQYVYQEIMKDDIILSLYIEKYQHNADCILLVGSRAEGISTRTSDIDLIILTESPEKYGVKSNNYLLGKFNDIKFEILIITKNDLKKTIKESFVKKDFYTLQKILFGRVIFGNLNFDIERHKKEFRVRYYIKNTDQALKMYYALEGIKCDCHLQQYAFSLKKYLEKIAEIYLFQRGDNYIKPRWLISRLIRSEGEHSPLLKAFFKAIHHSTHRQKDIDELECQVMNITGVMLYKSIYHKEATINENKNSSPPRFYAMERESQIILFCARGTFLMPKENGKDIIEKMIF